MLEHHLQREIIYRLALTESLRFSELQPSGIENKLFNYHLKKVMTAKYVVKNRDWLYTLSPAGRQLGLRLTKITVTGIDQPHSILFLVVRRRVDQAWLLYKRGAHPLKDMVGFMHAVPESEKSTEETAANVLNQKTGLIGTFKVLGGGYFRIINSEGNLESFTHFTLLICDNAVGTLRQTHDHADYQWFQDPDFTSRDMLPNMPYLVEEYQIGRPFFLEKTLQIK